MTHATTTRTTGAPTVRAGLLALALLLAVGAAAQTPAFTPLLTGCRVSAALHHDGLVYCGLVRGGVVVWDPRAERVVRRLDRLDGLGGHGITDLTMTGSRLWVATSDGGLTAITDPGGADEALRVYSSALSSLSVTAVSGQILGDTERVFYGTAADGIGTIVSGLPGAYYTTLDGLIDDRVVDLVLTPEFLLVATPAGVSRYADNAFTNYPYADAQDDAIRDLELGPDGAVWAATATGVVRWDDASRTWQPVFSTNPFRDLARDGDRMLALRDWPSLVAINTNGGAVTVDLPAVPDGQNVSVVAVAAGGGSAWAGGYIRPDGATLLGLQAARPWVATAGDLAAAIHEFDTCIMGWTAGIDGVAIDGRGRPWLGDQAGDGLAAWDGEVWYNAVDTASVANDSLGFFDWSGNILAMAAADDEVWFGQFTKGIVRFAPAAAPGGQERWELFSPENSPLLGDAFIEIAVHPDGPVFFGTDNVTFGGTDNDQLGADVLVDPARSRDPQAWLHLAPASLGGNVVRAVAFEGRDVVWLAVAGAGLVRWDVNGLGAGPDAPLTWTDPADDHWAGPFDQITGSQVDLGATLDLLAGPGGTMFAAGSGLVQFRYDAQLAFFTLVGEWQVKVSTFSEGLLAQSVLGLAWDRNQDLWALTAAGLNRLRFTADGTAAIDAFTDLATYFTLDPSFYAPSAIVPLPGGTYRKLAGAADGSRLVVSSDRGAAQVDIRAAGGPSEAALAAAYLFPNPFPGTDGADRINLGGLDVSAAQPVTIEVVNLLGQVVFRSRELDSATALWDGRTRQGERVASGLYVVKIVYGGATATRTLAVAY